MNDLELLGSIGHFYENELLMFQSFRQIRLFKKNQQILNVGDVCKSIYFLKKGAIVQYKLRDEIEKIYVNLHVENEWVVNNRSLISQRPLDNCIEAFTDCEVLEISLYALHKLIESSQNFLQFARILNPVSDQLDFFNQGYSAAEKYDLLLHHNPKIIQTFPLKAIASYLKTTPETLSRIRAKY
jgi:CRP-like cAMP-binding protein